MSKPFSPRELVARVRSILRRIGSVGRFTRGSLVVDVDQYEVLVDGREVPLTTIEFKLLRTLAESPGRVFTRDQLLATIHPFDDAAVVGRAIDVHIVRSRETLGDDPAQPRFISNGSRVRLQAAVA